MSSPEPHAPSTSSDSASTAPERSNAPLLAIDSATPTARFAVIAADGRLMAGREATAERHAANALRLVDEVLAEAGVRVGDLGLIACGAGPGSFTGLRVGMSVAKGLAMVAHLPIVLVSSLNALALDLAALVAPPAHPVHLLPVLDAGKGEVYAAIFSAATVTAPEAANPTVWALAPAALAARIREVAPSEEPLIYGGPGVARHAEALAGAMPASAQRREVAGPTAASVARLARLKWRRGERDDLASAVPLYGRAPDITAPKPRR